jgi:hypothetical protein
MISLSMVMLKLSDLIDSVQQVAQEINSSITYDQEF